MGWPGIDYEELEGLLSPSTANDLREMRNAALGHLAKAHTVLEAMHKRGSYSAAKEAMSEIEAAGDLIRGK